MCHSRRNIPPSRKLPSRRYACEQSFFLIVTISFQQAWHIVITINNLGLIIILNDYKIDGAEIP